MNLLTALDIYSGGPGSGCNGPNCGRPRFYISKKNLGAKKVPGMVSLSDLRPGQKFLNSKRVAYYVEKIRNGNKIPYVLVSPLKNKDGSREIDDGHHRFAALKMLGFKKIPVVMYSKTRK